MIQTLKSYASSAGHASLWDPPVKRADDPSAIPGQSLENPQTSWDRVFETQKSYSGKSVSEISALQLAAVWRCVAIISGTVARTPFLPYRRTPKGKILARDHYLWPLLTIEANPFMSAYRFKRIMQTRACLWGNAHALIVESGRGQITELWPLRPDRMKAKEKCDSKGNISGIIYEYTLNNRELVTFQGREILHIRGLETDGLNGLSPIAANRQAIGLGLAAEEYGARYFGQGTHVGGWVSHPGPLSPTAKKNLGETLNDLYGGLHGAHKLAVLEEGMSYKAEGIPPEDMQFLQTRQFQAVDIARLFGVPPHMIAELSKATFSNIEQQGIDFVTQCMDDWFSNWEGECTTALLSPREISGFTNTATGETYSIELDFYEQKLLRGDQASRYAVYSIGRQNTLLSSNDCREMEGLNRIDEPWADDYMQPLNMITAGEDKPESEDPEVIDGDDDAGSGNDPDGDDDAGEEGQPQIPGVSPLPTKKEKKHARHLATLNGYHR